MRLTKAMKTKLGIVLTALMLAVSALPSLAVAQQVSPTADQYQDNATQISTGANPPSDSGSGSGLGGNVGPLPFTGFDVLAMAAVALAVTGLGLALQRAVSREPGDELN